MWKNPNHPREEWELFYSSLAVSLLIYFAIFFSIHFFSEKPEGMPPDGFLKILYFTFMNAGMVSIGPFAFSAILAYFRPALAAGACLGMAVFCGAFSVWSTDALAWILYFFSLPAGLLACLALGCGARSLPRAKAFLLSLGALPATMYVNALIVYFFY